jgi:hypothetical protein
VVIGGYWTYSIGSFVVWGILLAVAAANGSEETRKKNLLLVFGGWTISWSLKPSPVCVASL